MLDVQKAENLFGRPVPWSCVQPAIRKKVLFPAVVRCADVFPEGGPYPFLTWAGSKAALLGQYQDLLPSPHEYSAYVEAFLGGGSLFWHLQGRGDLAGKKVTLIEANPDTANAWIQLQKNPPEDFRTAWQQLAGQISGQPGFRVTAAEYKKVVRRYNTNRKKEDPLFRAILTIYLSRTARNGLHRVRKRDGGFNVPFDPHRTGMSILPFSQVEKIHAALAGAEIVCGDFDAARRVMAETREAFYWFDPPYFAAPGSGFDKYTAAGFGEMDLYRLITLAEEIRHSGGKCMFSNTFHPRVRDVFERLGLNRAVVYRYGAMRQRKGKYQTRIPTLVPEYLMRSYRTEADPPFLAEAKRLEALHTLYASFAGLPLGLDATFALVEEFSRGLTNTAQAFGDLEALHAHYDALESPLLPAASSRRRKSPASSGNWLFG